MNILHVIRDLSPETGGPITALKEMAASQAKLGHRVVVAATDFGVDSPPMVEGVDIHAFACSSAAWRWSQDMGQNLPALVNNADIVHIHTLWEYPTWVAARTCRKLKRPYIIRPCGMLDAWSMSQRGLKKKLYLKILLGSAFSGASALHFTTNGELQKSVSVGNIRGRFVVPIGVPLPKSDVMHYNFRSKHGIPEKVLTVLFLGRIHYKKQPDLLIKAFGRVVTDITNARLVMAGPVEAGYRTELQLLADNLGLGDKVIWLGPLDRGQVAEAYATADLFVLPSLQENFGISVAEAMAAGCPVIVSERVDLAVDVKASSAGIVCANDLDSVVDGMALLLSNPSQRKIMGENGRRLIVEMFSPAVVARELQQVYDDICTARVTSPAWR